MQVREFASAAELREHYRQLTLKFFPYGRGYGCHAPVEMAPPPSSPPEPDPPPVLDLPKVHWWSALSQKPVFAPPPDPAQLLTDIPRTDPEGHKKPHTKAYRAAQAEIAAIQYERITSLMERLKPLDPRPNIRFIQKVVSLVWGVSVEDIMGASRAMHLLPPRHAGMFLSRVISLKSYPEIGRAFGGRDHTSVFHACRKYSHLLGLPHNSKLPLTEVMEHSGQAIQL